MDERITRWLPVKLTQDEIIDRARQLSERLKEEGEKAAEKARVTTQFANELKNLEGEISRLSNTVRSGEEYRNVDCFVKKNFSKKIIQVYRADTQAIIESRTMDKLEMQQELEF